MRLLGFFCALVLVLALSGCASRRAELAGVWESAPPTTDAKGSISDELLKGILGLAGNGAMLEFSESGRYKLAFAIVSVTGRWSMSGDEVLLTPEKKDPEQQKPPVTQNEPLKLRLSADGSTLSSTKEFESDPQFVFKRRQPGSNRTEPVGP